TSSAVVVFARAPQREAKRLGLSHRDALRVHTALLARALKVAGSAARVVVALDGEAPVPAGALRIRQRGEGFEERLLNALAAAADVRKGWSQLNRLCREYTRAGIDDRAPAPVDPPASLAAARLQGLSPLCAQAPPAAR